MNEASNAVTERTDDSPQPKAEMADLRMPTKRAARLQEALVVSLLNAGVLALVYTPLVLGQVVFFRDTHRLHHPMRTYFLDRVSRGELPLWYPFEALGVPFISSAVTAVFHPFTWLTVPFGPVGGMMAGHLLSVIIATTGAFLLARRLGAKREGASLAAITFGANGVLVSMLDNQTFLYAAVSFPWLLMGLCAVSRPLHRPAAEKGSVGPALPGRHVGLVLGASAVAWALLAGDIQGTLIMGAAGLVIALSISPAGQRLGVFALVAGSGALGLALSAIQLFPTLAVAPLVDRAQGLPWGEVIEWSFHPLRLSELFIPHQPVLEWQPVRDWLYPDRAEAWHGNAYLGFVCFLALVSSTPLALGRGSKPALVRSLMAVAALCLWLSLGRWGGLYLGLYEAMPLWNGFRFPEKIVVFATLPLGLLAGLGLDRALAQPHRAVRLTSIMVLIVAAFGLLVWLASSQTSPIGLYANALAGSTPRTVAIGVAIVLMLLLLWKRPSTRRSFIVALFPLLALLDVAGPVSRPLDWMSADPIAFESPSVVGAILGQELQGRTGEARVTSVVGNQGVLRLPEGSTVGHALPLEHALWARNAVSAAHSSLFGLESTGHYLPTLSQRLRDLQLCASCDFVLLNAALFNGRYLVASAREVDPMRLTGYRLIDDLSREFGLYLFEHQAPLPRAFVATPHFCPSPSEARAMLQQSAVLRGEIAAVETARPAGWVNGDPQVGEARVVSHTPEEVIVEASLDGPGLLVLNDAYWPGWVAEVDGQPATIHRANYLVRGVLLAEGRHTVRFHYPAPPSLLLGALTSLLALLFLLGLYLWVARRSLSPDHCVDLDTK